MNRRMRIDFVSDVSCPWCVIGLLGLEQALDRTRELLTADIHFQPFELNPDMAPEGEEIVAHIQRKYGSTPEQAAANRAVIRARAAALGFAMPGLDEDRRIYNTFDAHRLLHWAEIEGKQAALKHALFRAYFSEGRNPSDRNVLTGLAADVGLDATTARDVLDSGRYAPEVREAERLWQSRGIHAVPSVIIDGRYLIQGGQPPEAFEQALRQIAAQPA
jgi:predicted DsbA family dithiol-disulfide isomerase